jgi:hypothetical protein
MLSENKKEFPFSLPFSAHRRLQPKSPKSADAPSFFSTGPLLLLRPQPSLAQIADPPDPVHPPPWPFTSPRGAHPGQIPSSPVSMAGTGGAGRRLPLGVRVVRACPTSCPVPYIVAPAEAPACPSPATRRLARPRRRTLPVRRRPGPPPPRSATADAAKTNQGLRDAEPNVHRPSLAPGSHLCAAVAWEVEPADRDLPPPSDYSRLPSPFAPVSIPLYSPRPPLFFPHSIEP